MVGEEVLSDCSGNGNCLPTQVVHCLEYFSINLGTLERGLEYRTKMADGCKRTLQHGLKMRYTLSHFVYQRETPKVINTNLTPKVKGSRKTLPTSIFVE